MRFLPTLLLSTIILSSATAFAAVPTIDVGSHDLLPNVASQDPIYIYVSGTEEVQGLNFRIQVADGFPDVPSSILDAPNIVAVDLIGTDTDVNSQTIFYGNNTGQQDVEHRVQAWDQQITTQSGSVVADGLLARVWFDTTGFDSIGQEWEVILTGGFLGDTDFGLTGATVSNGTLTIVPEPQSVALVVISALAVLGMSVRRRMGLSLGASKCIPCGRFKMRR